MSKKNHPAPPPPPPHHANEKPPKKRGGGCLLLLILLLILIILLLLLLNYLGLFGGGLGKEKNSGSGGDGSSVSSTIDKAIEDSTADQKVYADITVSGDSYIYGNNNTEVSEIIKSIKELGDDVVVRINDQNASYNAMEQLKKALDEGKISYSETN